MGPSEGTAVPSNKCNAAMESVRKLEEFEATLSHGKDLFHSTSDLLAYSFGSECVKDVCLSAISCPEYENRCKIIATRLCELAISALEPLFVKDRNATDTSFFMEQVKLFWEVYQLKSIPNFLPSEKLSSLDEMLNKLVLLLCETGVDPKSRKILPADILRLVDKEQEPTVDLNYSVKQLPYFLKDLSLSHSDSVENVLCESASNSGQFVRQMSDVLDMILAGNVDALAIQELSKVVIDESDWIFPCDDVVKLTVRIVSVMDTILASSPDVVAAFFAAFQNMFCSFPANVKDLVIKHFCGAWIAKFGNWPSLGEHLKNFDMDVTECVNGIGDHVEIQNNFPKFKKIRDKLSFYLFVNPLPTLRRLLIQTLDNKLIVPGVLNILRHCSVLFEQENNSENVPTPSMSALTSCIVSLFEEEAHRWTNTEQQDRLVYLLSSLCRRKRRDATEKPAADRSEGSSSTAVESSIMNANVLVTLFVLPNLMKRAHEILMLKLLHRLMQTVGVKETHFDWSTTLGKSSSRETRTPELILLIVELFMEYEQKNPQAADICHSLLKTLGKKLSSEDVVFEQETANFILFSMRRYPWWVRYAVCAWFSRTLSEPKQQLPTGLYKCLALDQQEQSEQIAVDFPFSPAECFFRSFFELALFDVDLASDFLKKEISVRPRDENLIEKIAMALVDSCEQMHYRQRISALSPLLSELLRALDPSREVRIIDSLCESTFHGLRLIQHLLVLAVATKLAYFKVSNAASLNSNHEDASECNDAERARVADDLLQAFCELTKSHVEKEVLNLRRSKLPYPPEIKEDIQLPCQVIIKREERVYSQVSLLFNVACSITRLVSKPPFALQVLINCLAELLYEIQNMRLGTFLDDLPSDHFKSNTVYVVAQPTDKKQPNTSFHTGDTLKKKPTHVQNNGGTSSRKKACCAENELFGAAGLSISAMDPLATVKQISGINMRRNAEKRLVNKGSATNMPSPEDSRDNSGKNGKKKRDFKRR
ncbi:hypothetical protein V3C99_011116 [Haemonchus contortus]